MATPPVIALEKLQYGVQSAVGTSVPATRVVDTIQGTVKWRPDMKAITVRNSGTFANANRGYAGQLANALDFEASLTFNRLSDIGALFFDKVSTGTGSGATRTWTFTSSDTTDNLARYSVEYGGTNFPTAYLIQDMVGQKLDISIKANESWHAKATLVGTSYTTGSLTGALSLPSSLQGDDALWTQSTVYVDNTSATYGTTVFAGDMVSVDFTLENGISSRYTLDATNAPTAQVLANARKTTAKVVLQYDTQAEYTAAFASTARRFQVRATGPNSRSAKINISGYWDVVNFGNDGGVKTMELDLKGLDDTTTLTSDVQLIVINGVTTLTTIP